MAGYAKPWVPEDSVDLDIKKAMLHPDHLHPQPGDRDKRPGMTTGRNNETNLSISKIGTFTSFSSPSFSLDSTILMAQDGEHSPWVASGGLQPAISSTSEKPGRLLRGGMKLAG